jgi:hypothetical protein
MHDDDLSYAETFDQALEGLFQEQPPTDLGEAAPTAAGDRSVNTLIQDANAAFEDYLQALGEKRFTDAARALNTLQQALQQLSTQAQTPSNQPRSQSNQNQSQE